MRTWAFQYSRGRYQKRPPFAHDCIKNRQYRPLFRKLPVWTAIGFHNSDLHKIISYRYRPFFMTDHFSTQSLFATATLVWPGEWIETKKGLIKVGSAIYDLPQIVISQLCVSQIADKKTDKWVFIPFYIPLTKIQFDEISKLEFKNSKLCLQSKKGKPAS